MIETSRARAWALAFLAAALLLAAPTAQSLWIDEATMALLARAPDAHAFGQALAATTTSEALMPLATGWFWAAEKLLGDGERALRLANLPWLWLGVACLALLGRRIGVPWLPLLFALHPFVWQQADEIRPYAIQLGAGCWLALGLVQLLQDRRSVAGIWNVGLAAAAVTGASLLGLFVVAAAGLLLLIAALRAQWRPIRAQTAALAGTALLNAALLLFLARHLLHGAQGSKAWQLSLLNPGFSLYELLGFSALGPGRQDLREAAKAGGLHAVAPLLAHALPVLAGMALLYLIAAWTAKRFRGEPAAIPWISLAVAVLGAALLCAASFAVRFPFWGRHLSPVLPFLLVFLAALLAAARPGLKWAFLALLLAASLNQRLNPDHRKDDYRDAVALARQAASEGKKVCWIAAPEPAAYYHLPLSGEWPPAPGTVSAAIPSPGEAPPDLLIVSKPDLSDAANRRLPWIKPEEASASRPYPTFSVYERRNGGAGN